MFLLIVTVQKSTLLGTGISIHLMFLLIVDIRTRKIDPKNFNTSHVSINPASMLLICLFYIISIHLMFLLIYFFQHFVTRKNYFNTSHVSINLALPYLLLGLMSNFNTSHVSINQVCGCNRRFL